jgi:hypothetical protein
MTRDEAIKRLEDLRGVMVGITELIGDKEMLDKFTKDASALQQGIDALQREKGEGNA